MLTAPSDFGLPMTSATLALGIISRPLTLVVTSTRSPSRAVPRSPVSIRISFCLRSTGTSRRAVVVHPDDADLAAARLVEDLHRPRGVVRQLAVAGIDAGEDAVAGAGHDAGRLRLQDCDARLLALVVVPLRREGVEVVGIGVGGDVEHRHLRQRRGAADGFAGAGDEALALHLLEENLEGRPHVAVDAEVFCEVALAVEMRLIGHRFEDGFAGRESADGVSARRLGFGMLVWRSGH